MQQIKKQEFNFTPQLIQEEIKNWKRALKDIPLSGVDYWVTPPITIDPRRVDKTNILITAVYKIVSTHKVVSEIVVRFYDDSTSEIFLSSSEEENSPVKANKEYYESVLEAHLKFVNLFLEKNDITKLTELCFENDVSLVKNDEWQDGYDFLCGIARQTVVPKLNAK